MRQQDCGAIHSEWDAIVDRQQPRDWFAGHQGKSAGKGDYLLVGLRFSGVGYLSSCYHQFKSMASSASS